jgi:hypothetical protein
MLWIQDESAPDGGWRVDARAGQTASAGGHSYELTAPTLFGIGRDGFFGSVVVGVDSTDFLQFDLVGRLAGIGDLPDGGLGLGLAYRYDALLTRNWCSCGPGCLSANCQTCGGATYRHYQVTRSPEADNRATYLFVADEPPRGCGSGVDLLEMEFHGS